MKTSKKFLFALLSGFLLALSFPPMPFYLFAFIAFVPILFVITNEEKFKHKNLMIYLVFFIYHTGTNWWISSWQSETDPFLMASGLALCFVHPLLFMLPIGLFSLIKKKISTNLALWLFPFLWTGFEFAHGLGEFSYPWLSIGNTQFYNHYWVQIIDIIGAYGASFLIALINVLMLKLILFIRKNTLKSNEIFKYAKSRNYIIAIVLLILIPNIYGIFRVNHFDILKYSDYMGKSLNVGIIQPNINPWRKWETSVPEQIEIHKHLQDSLSLTNPKLDLAVWCETSIPYMNIETNAFHEYPNLTNWVDTSNVALLTGFTELKLFDNEKEATPTARKLGSSSLLYESYNTALLLSPNIKDKNRQIYKKMRLTPMAERLPYADYLLFARGWFEWSVGISAWGIGKEQKNLNLYSNTDSIPIATIICIESIYPDFVRNFANQGAELFTVITNDAWYDYTFGPRQHYILAAMRAIENRRYLVRAANSGISGIISPTGESIIEAPPYKSIAISGNVQLQTSKTFYTKYGDIIAWLSIFISLASLVFIIFKKKENNDKSLAVE